MDNTEDVEIKSDSNSESVAAKQAVEKLHGKQLEAEYLRKLPFKKPDNLGYGAPTRSPSER